MLNLDLRIGESVQIGDAVVTLLDKSGKLARLSIRADKTVPIKRVESNIASHVAKHGLGPMPAPA